MLLILFLNKMENNRISLRSLKSKANIAGIISNSEYITESEKKKLIDSVS